MVLDLFFLAMLLQAPVGKLVCIGRRSSYTSRSGDSGGGLGCKGVSLRLSAFIGGGGGGGYRGLCRCSFIGGGGGGSRWLKLLLRWFIGGGGGFCPMPI